MSTSHQLNKKSALSTAVALPPLDLTAVRRVPPGARTGRMPTNAGAQSRLLTQRDMKFVNDYISFNMALPHTHRSVTLPKALPQCPVGNPGVCVDDVVRMHVASVPALASPLDIPLRFVPPGAYHTVAVKDPCTRSTVVQQLFATMKGAANLPNREATTNDNVRQKKHPNGRATTLLKDYELRSMTSRRNGDKRQEATSLVHSAIFSYNACQYENTVQSLQRCVGLFEALQDSQGLALCHNLVGTTYFWMGEHKMALHHFQKQETLCGSYGKAVALNNMGVTYAALGEKEYALYAMQDALYCARDANEHSLLTIIEGNHGLAEFRNGNPRAAQEHLEQCLEGCSIAGDRAGAAIALQLLGDVYYHASDMPRAAFYYENALKIATESRLTDVAEVSRVCLGVVKASQAHEDRLLQVCSTMGSTLSLGDVLRIEPHAEPQNLTN
eukprot:PhM_4_TR8373/c0_g2_i1/m.66031